MKKGILSFLLAFIISVSASANSIGSWSSYLAYHSITEIAPAGNIIYILSNNDIYSYNIKDGSVTLYDKTINLSDCGITHIAYCKSTKSLVVTYSNSNIDIISNNGSVTNISDFYNKSITEEKTINSINIDGYYAYLSTDFGIVKLNVRDAEISNTYNIGMVVNSSVVLNNRIYISTNSNGIYSASLNDNLLDINNWHIEKNDIINHIYYLKGKIICFIGGYIYQYIPTEKRFQYINQGTFNYFSNNEDQLIMGNSSYAYIFNNSTTATTIKLPNNYNINYLVYDATNKCYWHNKNDELASSSNVNDSLNNQLSGIVPESPVRNYFNYLLYTNNTLYSCGGGYLDYTAFNRTGTVQSYSNNKWTIYQEQLDTITNTKYKDVSSIAVDPSDPNHVFCGSGGRGVYEFENSKFVKNHTYSNSPLHSTSITNGVESPQMVYVNGLKFDSEGNLWMLNAMSSNALLEYTKDKTWKTDNKSVFFNEIGHSFNNLQSTIIDSRGLIWFVNAHWEYPALFCYNPSTDEAKVYDVFINQDGTTLSVGYTRCVTEDIDGNIWLGTSKGPLELTSSEISSGGTTFTQVKVPRNDGSNYADYLLDGVDITCITIDGAGRKWFGTGSNGVYLISADNMVMVHHFLSSNSDLLSNGIESIAINGNNGEVFFGTDKGLISYMSDANTPVSEMSKDNIYAYPNPVTPDYTGLITVTGLSLNANVIVTTSNGRKVAEGTSNGGMFTWDGKDYDGKRVASGIYNVVTATSDGNKGTVCKIAIIK